MPVNESDAQAEPVSITAVVANPRRAGRWDIVSGREHLGTLSHEGVERLALRPGTQVTGELRERIADESAAVRVFDRALAMLAFRARAARELRRSLLAKGERADHVDAAIARLTALGHLDDASFARQFVRARMTGAGLSARRLESELFRRGIPSAVAAAAVAEVVADEAIDTDALLEELARRRVRALGDLEPLARRRRLYAFLARRGYGPDEIRRVLDIVLRDA